jgi:hypothetical protein
MTKRKSIRTLAAVAGLTLAVAPAAYAFWSEAALDRAAALLGEIRDAQEIRFAGRKVIESPDGSVTLDLRADRPGRIQADVVSRTGRRSHGSRGSRGRFSDPELISRNYALESRGSERIAGRDARRYALVPRHPGRSSYSFAVDASNRFLLAFRAVGADGSRTHDSRFESISFDPPPATVEEKPARPSQDRPRRITRQRVTVEDLRGAMPFQVYMPKWTPPGFKLKSVERYVIRDLGETVLARWSDGMAGIHVLQTSAANPSWELFRVYLGLPETPPAGAETGGGTVAWRMKHAGGALLDLTLDGTEVLIGGQGDPDDLKKMADHLRNIED